jgi:hypothetical protein
MIIVVCLTIPLLSLCISLVRFLIWLSHSLEGYPAFMIVHANADATQPWKSQFAPNSAPVLDYAAHRRSEPAQPEILTASITTARAGDPIARNKTAVI